MLYTLECQQSVDRNHGHSRTQKQIADINMDTLLTKNKSLAYLRDRGWTLAQAYVLLAELTEQKQTVKMGSYAKYRQSDLTTAINKRLERPTLDLKPVSAKARARNIRGLI